MKRQFQAVLLTSALLTPAILFAADAQAQDQAAASTETVAPVDEIVVTAVARGQNRLNSSVTVSSLSSDDIAKSAPRSVAEIFRNLPGIRSESSGGEGN
ncbi:MAG: TonB-dependent receptor, partial [Sphingobium sp.]